MQHRKWLVALVALVIGVGAGLIAGCGSSDNNTTSASTDTSATDTSATSTGSSTSSGGGATADDVTNACLDAVKGTPAESAAQTACQQAGDAFQQCADQAQAAGGSTGDTALKACQDAADSAVAALKSGTP